MSSIRKLSLVAAAVFISLTACGEQQDLKEPLLAENTEAPGPDREKTRLSPEFKSYWYAGEAELTSYALKQARYGELRDGTAVLVYVTEPFLSDKQVKANRKNEESVSVLKLNATKKYLTGIYPYSIMSSTFYPVDNDRHALKVSNSVQEWCGQVYAQLNNRDDFEVMAHSYFESEADQDLNLPKTWLENEFWTILRIDPSSLPVGEHQVVPSFEYIRLGHIPFKAVTAQLANSVNGDSATYTVSYPEIRRELRIRYNPEFPFDILGWEETFSSGFGPDAEELTSTATKITSLKTPYWQKNSNKDVVLRDSLGL